MSKEKIEAIYELSPMQEGMFFHSQFAPQSGVYFQQLNCVLEGQLHTDAFQRAWQRVVEVGLLRIREKRDRTCSM